MRQLAGVLALAAAIVLALILLSQRGGGDEPDPGARGAGGVVGAAQTRALFAGIPQTGTSLGDPRAPVVLRQFADTQCPFCRDYALSAMPELIRRYVRTGKLRMELRLISIVGPESAKAARAAVAASQRDRMWQYVDLLYRNQGQENTGWVTDDLLGRLAAAVPGLQPTAVVAAANKEGPRGLVLARAAAEAQGQRIDSTPSFLLGRRGQAPKRLKVERADDPDAFAGPIDGLLAAR